ncbi:MAG: Na/Pi symporter, partial [Christensenellales bacterium]
MTIYDIFSLLGGLGLFLYGMDMMGKGLESAAGNKLKTVLEKLTSNRLRGVLVGALVTCVIQSSSATTVMVVGFVNAGLMNLSQAFGVILGANIGTTITAQIIALDLSELAPLFIIIGVAPLMFSKRQSIRNLSMV